MQPNSRIAEALVAFKRGELARARALAQAQLEAEQGPPEVDHLLGLIECREGRMASGITHLRAALDAQPRNALLDRTHDAVVREVKDGIERGRIGKRLALWRSARAEKAADLGREHELIARLGPQDGAETLLREAVSILRRGIEKANARRPSGLDDAVRLVIREGLKQTPQGSSAETQPCDLERRGAKLDPLCRIQADAPVSTCFRSQRSPLAMCAVAAARASSGSPCMIAS